MSAIASSHCAAPPPGSCLAGYRPQPGAYDEMMLPNGGLRPHWQTFGSFLAQCSPDDLRTRQETVQRLLNDHGVTYNIYDDGLGTSRPWALDLLPFIVAPEDWQHLRRGLDQRARLLNALLADVYGPQRLIRAGLLPPRLVQANPGFLRPAAGVNPPGGHWASQMGFDLVRDARGQWLVLADRTQAPSGHGYALENRIILTHVFAEEFHASHVQRLGAYYDRQRDLLRSLAPKNRSGPGGILMLSPGPYNETYYEHAFQARHLGFPLVEGADLTVRERHVYLKTLEGLRRVDVILRHVDDDYCDPLELHSQSLLGAAGLTEAWRNGNVALANGLGAGVVETPALHPFLPGICRHLLGEDLQIPCVPTWWCGQQRELELVLADPDRWVVKPAFVRGARDPVFVADLDAEQKRRLLDALRAAPHEWVAQEVLDLSTTPTWTGAQVEPRSLVWRVFASAASDGSFTAMPGGLTRVSPEPQRWLVTMRSGGISKDTWVPAEGPVEHPAAPARPPSVIRPARPPSAVPSRAADHLFWLGRYSERLEQTVRVLRTAVQRFIGEPSDAQSREIQACVALLAGLRLAPAGTGALMDHLETLLQDPRREGSIPDLIGRLRFNAAAARDRLSDDTWRLCNHLERDARLPAGAFAPASAQAVLDTLILDLAAISGMQQENMTRGHGWRFLEIGRRIERACSTLSLIRASTLAAAHDDSGLGPLLEICDSTMTYRRLHFARPALLPMLDLLLLDDSNPRSVVHQLRVLGRQAAQLPQDPQVDTGIRERQQADVLQSELAALNLQALARDAGLLHRRVPAVCELLNDGLEHLSNLITEHYFNHAVRHSD